MAKTEMRAMKLTLIGLVTGLAIAMASTPTRADSLINNGGFETGDLTGFTLSGNAHDYIQVTSTDNDIFGSYVNSGNFGLQYGPTGSDGYLSQTITTVAGMLYNITFYVNSAYPSNFAQAGFLTDLSVSFGGTQVVDLPNIDTGEFQQYSYTATANSTSTDLTFGLRNDGGFSGLDDIAVTSAGVSVVPLPSTLPLFGVGIALLAAFGSVSRSRRARKTTAVMA